MVQEPLVPTEAGCGVVWRGPREDVCDPVSVADAGSEPGERHRSCGCVDAGRCSCSGQGPCRFVVSRRDSVAWWGGCVGHLAKVVFVELNENLSPPRVKEVSPPELVCDGGCGVSTSGPGRTPLGNRKQGGCSAGATATKLGKPSKPLESFPDAEGCRMMYTAVLQVHSYG